MVGWPYWPTTITGISHHPPRWSAAWLRCRGRGSAGIGTAGRCRRAITDPRRRGPARQGNGAGHRNDRGLLTRMVPDTALAWRDRPFQGDSLPIEPLACWQRAAATRKRAAARSRGQGPRLARLTTSWPERPIASLLFVLSPTFAAPRLRRRSGDQRCIDGSAPMADGAGGEIGNCSRPSATRRRNDRTVARATRARSASSSAWPVRPSGGR